MPDSDSNDPRSGASNHAGTLGSAGSAGKLTGTGGTGLATAGSGGASQAGMASGGKTAGGGGSGGSEDEGGTNQGGSGGSGSAGKAGSGGKAQGGSAGTAGTTGSGGGGSGGGGSKLGCDDPLYVLCDDFEDGNASGWSTSGGTWTVVQNGSFVYRGANGGYQAYAGDPAWTDQIVEATLKGVSFGGTSGSYRVGIVARRTGSNFFAFALDPTGSLRLLRGSSSVPSSSGTCGDTPASPGASFTLRLEVTGPTNSVHIKTFLDGNPVHDCTTTNGLADGAAGVYTYGSKSVADFDDFKVSIP